MMSKIAIIGAGMAGLSCGRVLADGGHEIVLFDKGRGPGGRMSTRRTTTDLGEVSFDHGAQYFTARDPAFLADVQSLIDENAAAIWRGNLLRLAPDGTTKPLAIEPVYVGVPGMNGVIRALASRLCVRWGVRVETLRKVAAGWHLNAQTGADLGVFDAVVCAVPAEQVSALIGAHTPDLAALAQSVTSLPCWAGMFAFDAPLALAFDGVRLEGHPMIDFIAANHSKPGRADVASFVVHARADWSQAHLEEGGDAIAAHLLEGLLSFASNRPSVVVSTAHRWRYARVEVENGPMLGLDRARSIGVCGDYLAGPRVESAWLSGYRLGRQMTGR
jgi:renalase